MTGRTDGSPRTQRRTSRPTTRSLVIKDKAAHHAISAKFPKAIDNTKNTLVVQYEVKLQGKRMQSYFIRNTILTIIQMAWSAVVPT
jgi:hypothetical protein